ncbi:MAG: phosphoribosylamine--glycine ligase, partial [Phycisphaerales bacterium]|nr:phosphoribosylamine--glycine ligase [Phycisphaerales bacterium]
IIVPTIDALRRDDIEYRGVLYAGLMLTHAGPKVLEFNARFGDPECQCLVRRMTGDFAKLLYATATGQLASIDDFDLSNDAACCIVLASAGYPEKPKTGLPITGLSEAAAIEGVTIFHAGTRIEEKGRPARDGNASMQPGQLVTAGGRVLNVVATGPTVAEARDRALKAADAIQFEGKQYRKDIAWQAVGEKAALG